MVDRVFCFPFIHNSQLPDFYSTNLRVFINNFSVTIRN